MTEIDIISGFLGAGKTTFIQKLIREALKGQKVVLIENEFGEIGIDGGFLKDAGIEIREMNQGCICCSLVGDFETSLREVIEKYTPDRIIIEPSGVGKLSDIIGAVKSVSENLDVELNAAVTIVDAKKAKMYARNFGEFFNNQIQYAGAVVLSRTDIADEKKIEEAVEIVRGINPKAVIITTPEDELSGEQLMDIISRPDTMEEDMMREVMERVREHEHEHDDDDDEDEHHHHHDEDGHHHEDEEHHHHHHDEEDEEHHHHHHDEEEDEEHHHHDHDEDGDDGVHIHNHHHHHHHHHGEDHDADEIFTSWGLETPHAFTREKLDSILQRMSSSDEFGTIIRCKGMLPTAEAGKWMYFDMVPEQFEIRDGAADYTGKVVVIGADLREDALKKAFVG
jgi:G3E family GTPase